MIKHLGIVGAGTIGTGIAELAILAKVDVLVYDINETVLRRSFERIKTDLRRQVQGRTLTQEASTDALSRLHSRTSVSDLSSCDFIIEAVVEDLRVKRDIFKHLDANTRPAAILATTSTALPVTSIATHVRLTDRVIGMHFFAPVLTSKLVEIARGARTNDPTALAAVDLARTLGKETVTVRESPGFAVGRLSQAFTSEALQIAGEGTATPAQVDAIMKGIEGIPAGPFATMDADGLDQHLAVAKVLHELSFGDARFRPHPMLQQMVDSGRLGVKSGEGFVVTPVEGKK